MQILSSTNVKYLCVVYDQYLTFHDHLNGICKSTYFHLRKIRRNLNLFTCDATTQPIHAPITTHLDICKSTHFHLRKIRRNLNLFTCDATTQPIHAPITTHLDICKSTHFHLRKIRRNLNLLLVMLLHNLFMPQSLLI